MVSDEETTPEADGKGTSCFQPGRVFPAGIVWILALPIPYVPDRQLTVLVSTSQTSFDQMKVPSTELALWSI